MDQHRTEEDGTKCHGDFSHNVSKTCGIHCYRAGQTDTPKGADTMTTTSETSSKATPMKSYRLLWSPTAQVIATVQATTKRAAIRKAPKPYRRYLGEIYAEEM